MEEEIYVLYHTFCDDAGVTCRMVKWVTEGHYCRKLCLIREYLARYVS